MIKIHRPICIDYETFYDTSCTVRANVKNEWPGGAYFYTRHPKFYAYMVSYWDFETGKQGVIDDQSKLPAFVASLAGRTIVAHNAGFEDNVCQVVLPGFRPFNMFDTADLAAYMQCERSLLGASKHLLGKTISKEMRDSMSGVHYKDMPADRKKAMREYALTDVLMTGELFLEHQDVWPSFEQWVSNFTRQQNNNGIFIDEDYLTVQVDKMNQVRSAAIRKIPWCETDEDKPLSALKLARWCREQNLIPPSSIAEDDEDCILWEATYGDEFPVVGAMRDFRKANTRLKKLHRIARSVRPDGTMPLELLYFAAPHTGRFSSRGVNVQNLPTDDAFCDLRGCLIPAAGHKFVCSDLAGIEARCLPWLAGDTDYLAEVARLDDEAVDGETGDLYQPHAVRMFNYDPDVPLRADKDLRFATKVCILSLGYQTGKAKFGKSIRLNVPQRVVDRLSQSGETIEQLASRLVDLYRASNPKIQSLWYGMDRDLRAACGAGIPFDVQLPSGRVITYRDLALRESVDATGRARASVVGSVCFGEDRTHLYGGKCVENACQAMARDVFVSTMYNLDKAGFDVRFSCHDEAVLQVPDAQVSRDTCRQIEEIMSLTPDWSPGLPLASETSVKNRYAK